MKGREGRRGGGQREGGVGGDEFTVYNTRLDCVQEHFLYVGNVWNKVFISDSNLSSPVRFKKIDGNVVNLGRNQVVQSL